jgi:hemolysin III
VSQSEPHLETPREETLSSLTHGIGAVASLAAISILIVLAALHGGPRHIVTICIYGASLMLVYFASTCYHACRRERLKHWLRVIDHVGIYCLIAGTYTPFLLVSIRGGWGWSLFAILWSLALIGTVFKLFFVNRFDLVSTLVYIAMGWIGVVAAQPFFARLPGGALAWIFAGGIVYTLGVIFYFWDRLPFNHAIWHLFVLGGSACHFFAIAFYVVPR